MGRQIVKGLAMVMLLLTLALATAVATANGQGRHAVAAKVPFEFIVGAKTLAAGQYNMRVIGDAGQALSIQSADAKNRAIRLTNATAPQRDKRAKLVFHRYGNTYFLSEVSEGGGEGGWQLNKSKQERAMERELNRIAANRDTRNVYEEVVILATNR